MVSELSEHRMNPKRVHLYDTWIIISYNPLTHRANYGQDSSSPSKLSSESFIIPMHLLA